MPRQGLCVWVAAPQAPHGRVHLRPAAPCSPGEGAAASAPCVAGGPSSRCPELPSPIGGEDARHGGPCTSSSPSVPPQLEQFKADNQDIGFGSGTRALEQALEKTRSNINWVNENKASVLAWFTEHSQ